MVTNYIHTFTSEDIKDGTAELCLKLNRQEETRCRQLYRRDTLNRTLDIAESILLFLPEIAWRIVLMPILVLIDAITVAIKGGK